MKPRSGRSRESLLKLMATPVRRKYFETLRRMLGTSGLISIREEQFFLVLAIAIGILAGFSVVIFRIAIAWARLWLLGSSMHPSAPRVVLVPALMGLVIAFVMIRFFPRVRGSGVNQTKGALYIYDGYIAADTVIGKFVLSALAIGSGQSLGPEDPSLQIGAGLASMLGRWLKLSKERLRLVAPVGAAAGVAAAFNAPITAVLFVIEEVIGRWSAGILGAVVLSAISSVVVERWFMGDEPLFRVPQYHLEHAGELVAYAFLGVVGGVASLVFVKVIKNLRPKLRRLPQWSQYLQPGVAGLLIGFIAIWYPQVMGAGYEWIDLAMHSRFPWEALGIIAGLKLLSTALSFTTGTPGGLFAPVLFLGAMLGGSVAMLEQQLFPALAVPVGAYALVGMGALFAGILRAPMTSVFMILEVSGNYSIILPVIICNTISYLISRGFQEVPLFDLLSRQDGLDLPSLEEEREQAILRVEDAMHPTMGRALLGDEAIASARSIALSTQEPHFLVSLGEGRWSVVSREGLLDPACDEGAPVRVLVRARVPRLYQDQSLDVALRFMKDRPMLPVVHRGNTGLLMGVVGVEDILRAYRKAGLAEPETAEVS
ncbi:MAG TPA: chloride channel protein [Candidatus Saccharimonadales bacterium]|nr:chloride channel protein [Candidatus Saccharimonadales bacterium]